MKKILLTLAFLLIAGFALLPASTKALTVAEIQSQINQLISQINQLSVQLAALQGNTPVAVFTRNLTVGSIGDDVRRLQVFFNSNTDTMVALTGPGSPGNETTYFGGLTQAAAIKFQLKYAISPPAGFVGPITRAKINSLLATTTPTTPPPVTNPANGTFTATLASSPTNSTYISGSDLSVYGVNVNAYGSDITIKRLDLQVALSTSSSSSINPTGFVNDIKIYSGNTLVLNVPNPQFNQDSNFNYFVQLSGFNSLVPKNGSQTLTVKFSTSANADVSRSLTVQVYGNGIMGTDSANVNTFAALGVSRSYVILPPGGSTLTAGVATDNPASSNWYNDSVSGSTDVQLLRFNVSSMVSNATMVRLGVNLTPTAANRVLPSTLKLWDGNTLIASTSDMSGTVAVFQNFNLSVPANTSKTLAITGNYPVLANQANNVAKISIPVTSSNFQFQTANGELKNVTVPSQIEGNNQYLFNSGAKFTFISGSSNVSTSSSNVSVATGVLKFKVESFNGTFSKLTSAVAAIGGNRDVAVSAYDSNGNPIIANIAKVVETSPDQDTPSGSSAIVTVTITLTHDSVANPPALGYVKFKIDGIDWDMGVIANEVHQGPTTGNMFSLWQTNFVYVP